jgi:uncharacterized membrane protein YbaN (DUF454 family)
MKRITRPFWLILGTLAVILGVLGMFLPILPTTPFLLLAAFAYMRSSKRFYVWLIGNRYFGQYIENYRSGRGITRREKIISITALWFTITLSAFGFVSALWLRLLLFGIATAVTIHILRIRTYRPQDNPPLPVAAQEKSNGSEIAPN